MDELNYSGFVYLWENNITKEKYIGSHIGDINDGYLGSGVRFLENIKKYGIENFSRTILEVVFDRNQVRNREQYWLDYYDVKNNVFFLNVSSQARGGFDHINHNFNMKQQANEIISKKAKERLKFNHPKGFLGKKHSLETKQKIQEKTQAAMKLKVGKKVYQFDRFGRFLKQWDTISDAARFYNTSPSNILYTCDGKFKSCRGYIWSWEETPKHIPKDPTLLRWKGKKVHTPKGILTITDACNIFGFASTSHVRKLCLDVNEKNWYYIV